MQGRDLLSLTVPESGLTCSTSAKSSLSSPYPHRNYLVTVYDPRAVNDESDLLMYQFRAREHCISNKPWQ